jgi:hypothetical protein
MCGQRRIPADLPLGKRDGTILQGAGRAKGPVWIGVEKKKNVCSHRGFQPELFIL